jgi:D-alanyl-D-alanine carboxypeptidase
METTTPDKRGVRWGLGLGTGQFPCGTYWGHDGAVPGYNSIAYNSQDGQRQAVVLANSVTFSDAVGNAKAQRAFERLVTTAYCG